jgi:hypothetical protein
VNRLTKEREQEIRSGWNESTDCRDDLQAREAAADDIPELLSEIDALRAELDDCRQTRLAIKLCRLEQELDQFRERVEKLRAALEGGLRGLVWFIEGPYGSSPSADDLIRVRQALVQDEEYDT